MWSDEIRSWFALANGRINGQQAIDLIEKFGSIDEVARASVTSLTKAGLDRDTARAVNRPDAAALDAAVSWLEQPNHHVITVDSPDFPRLLLETPDAPLLLYLNGDPGVFQLPALAIVGSRNPSRGGVQNAHDFAMYLGASGFCIVSGLAQGIDTAAHTGALEAGAKTIAFLGHGIDRIYPAQNRDVAHQIAASGALVTEYPLGSSPRKEHFPERNRLISGCSMGTLVVEAARRSGSLITARLSSEQGREVFAIPGSIHNALSRGCHQLIRQGAKLVECAEDIVSELAPITGYLMQNDDSVQPAGKLSEDRDDDYKLLIKTLGHDPATADELAEKSGLTIDQVSSMLLILELEGEIEALNGGQYSLLGRSSWHERERTRRADVSV